MNKHYLQLNDLGSTASLRKCRMHTSFPEPMMTHSTFASRILRERKYRNRHIFCRYYPSKFIQNQKVCKVKF